MFVTLCAVHIAAVLFAVQCYVRTLQLFYAVHKINHSYTLLSLMCMCAHFLPVGQLIIEHIIIMAYTTHEKPMCW